LGSNEKFELCRPVVVVVAVAAVIDVAVAIQDKKRRKEHFRQIRLVPIT
jgi:hypothetical protein